MPVVAVVAKRDNVDWLWGTGGASKANSMHRSEDHRSTAAAAGGQLAYGVSVDVMADADGLPKARVSKKRHAKSLGLTVSHCRVQDNRGWILGFRL